MQYHMCAPSPLHQLLCYTFKVLGIKVVWGHRLSFSFLVGGIAHHRTHLECVEVQFLLYDTRLEGDMLAQLTGEERNHPDKKGLVF